MSTREESKLIRNLGFWDLMGIAIGQIIGAGIMANTGIAIGMTGTGVVLAFIISPFLTLLQIAPTAYMGAALPVTGGAYRYASRLLGKKAGFVQLTLYLVSNLTIALYALTFGAYWVGIFPGSARVVAAVMLTFFYATNLMGTKKAAVLNSIMSACMIGGILFFIAFGIVKVDFNYVFNPGNMFTGGTSGFLTALALLSFATGGAQLLAELGGETESPGKNLPRAMVWSTLGVGVLYAFMASVAAGVLPIEQVADQPLTSVAKLVLPTPVFYIFMIGAALGATATTLNATLSWISKCILVACEDGVLPKPLAKVSDRGVPVRILTLFYLVGLLPILVDWNISFVSRVGTSASLLNKLLICFAFMKVVEMYPKEMGSSVFKISLEGSKILGWVAAIVTVVLSASLILSLPTWAIVSFCAILGCAILYANFCLGKVAIPNDLAVNYTGGDDSA